MCPMCPNKDFEFLILLHLATHNHESLHLNYAMLGNQTRVLHMLRNHSTSQLIYTFKRSVFSLYQQAILSLGRERKLY